MSLIDRLLKSLEDRRNSILNGEINCIPSPFQRFREDFPGIERDRYYLVSGTTKSGKTQLTNYLFVYTPILYAYSHPEQVRVKIFYFPLEETQESITLRFMAYLLYTLSKGKIRISPTDLKSTNADKILDENILSMLRSEEYQKILRFYEKHVIFLSDRNPTGIYKALNKYAEETGTVHKKVIDITNKETGLVDQKEVFDYYEPKDNKEYVMCLVDHISLIDTERGFTLRESINKLSEYMMLIRNKYHFIPVIIQQQSVETSNLEAFKNNKIRPTMAGLADSKYTGKDCSIMLGITNPYAHELPEYLKYDITKLKDSARFLEVVLNREGASNGIVGLYFDGATNYFSLLPLPNDKKALEEFYNHISAIKSPKQVKTFITYSVRKLLNLFK